MQVVADPMSSKLFIHVVAMSFSVISNDVSNFAELHSRPTLIDRGIHRFSRYSRKPYNVRIDFVFCVFEHNHGRVVAMTAIFKAHYIYVQVVARLEHVVVRHTMTYNIIDRQTNRLGKMHEIYA